MSSVINPDEFEHLRNVEHSETQAADLLCEHYRILEPLLRHRLHDLMTKQENCGCPGCTYLLHVVYLGHDRIKQLAAERFDGENE